MAQPFTPTANEVAGMRAHRAAEDARRPLIEKIHGQFARGLITSIECVTQSLKIISDHPVVLRD